MFKTHKWYGLHFAEIVPMVMTMPIVKTDYTPIVACVDRVVDIRQVVTRYITLAIDPNLASQ